MRQIIATAFANRKANFRFLLAARYDQEAMSNDVPPVSTPPSPWRSSHALEVAVVIGVLALAAWLRIDRARWDGLTFDEQWHMELSSGRGSPHLLLPTGELIEAAPPVTSLRGAPPARSVWTHMTGVAHPPLFVTVLRLWRDVLGEADLPAKSLSIVCSLIAIALLYDAVRTLHGRAGATWAALLFALAPGQIYLAQQVRGYAMTQLLACGALAAMARFDRNGFTRWRMAALTVCATGLALTHYFGVITDLSLGAFACVRLRGRTRRMTLGALAVAGAIFLLTWAPFIPQQQRTVSQLANPWQREDMPAARHAVLTLGRAAAVPVRQIAEPISYAFQWPLIAAAALLMAAITLWRRTALWLLWLSGTLGFVAALDLLRGTNQLTYLRYTSLSAPAVFALLAAIGTALPGRAVLRHLIPAAACAFALVLWPSAYGRFDERDEPEWRALGEVLRQHAQRDDVFIFASGTQPRWYHEILYLGAAHYDPEGFPRAVVRLLAPASPALTDQLAGRSAWLISGPLDGPVEQLLPGAQLIEQYKLPRLALLTHVKFPATRSP
jgi:hypothetical protein